MALGAQDGDLGWLVAAGSADATLVVDDQLRVVHAVQNDDGHVAALDHDGFGRDTLGEIHPDDQPLALERLIALQENPGGTDFMALRVRRPSGDWLKVLFVATNSRHVEGINGIVLRVHVLDDLNPMVDAGSAGGPVVADRQPIADIAPCGIDVRDRDGLVTYSNEWLRSRFAPGGGPADWTSFAIETEAAERIVAAGAHGESVEEDVWLRLADSEHCFRVRVAPNRATDGSITGLVTTLIDITAEVISLAQIERSQRLLTATLDSLAQGVLIFAGDSLISYANPAVHEHIGVPQGTLVGSPLPAEVLERISVADDLAEGPTRGAHELQDGQPVEVNGEIIHYTHPDGSARWSSLSTAVIPAVEGALESVVLIIDDVTSRHEQTRLLAHQAMHDSLTGLPNRAAMLDFLAGALARQQRRDQHVCGVLYCDLDGFKEINDTLGHSTGDEVLITVANRIRGACRVADLVGRLGGDEFIVVLEELRHPVETDTVATRIIEAVATPVLVDGQDLLLGVSIGVAVSDGNEKPDAVLTRADAALYEAKRAGRGTWRSQEDIDPGTTER